MELSDECRKNVMLTRDYMLNIPNYKVDMSTFFTGIDEDKFLTYEGLDALKCHTVACLAGWIMTMPEYREWVRKNHPHTDVHALNPHHAMEWLIGERNAFTSNMFSIRKPIECQYPLGMMTDHEIAIHRLDMVLAGEDI